MQAYIFEEKYLTLQSNKDNMIAFQISLQLLTKIFAAAMAIEADSIQVLDVQPLDAHTICIVLTFLHTAQCMLQCTQFCTIMLPLMYLQYYCVCRKFASLLILFSSFVSWHSNVETRIRW